MSLGAGLSAALSGLAAAARAAEVVSSNIANARTEGYGRREIVLGASVLGGTGQGVTVRGVQRHADPILLGDRRLAEASSGNREATAAFLKKIESAVGTPDDSASLGSRIADLDAALLAAISRPESEPRLSSVLDAAKSLTAHLATAGDSIQSARLTADHRIGAEVNLINSALSRVAELNGAVRKSIASGRDSSALLDMRQQVIDSISEMIPLREVDRGNGQIALFTMGGAVILDGTAAQFGFSSVGVIAPEMSAGIGTLSGLTLGGRPLSTAAADGPISGGTLTAQFEIRDRLAPDAQAKLDAVARNLIERFANPDLDSSLAAGAAGVFTDTGGPLDPAREVGLAQRLAVNALVDPGKGGALWRLRDGLGATSPGPVGNSSLLNGMQIALTRNQSPASGGFNQGARSLSVLASDFLSSIATARVNMDAESTYAASRLSTLKGFELENGVDTDQELQSLMLIEQAYAANAKVTSTINDLLKTLMEI